MTTIAEAPLRRCHELHRAPPRPDIAAGWRRVQLSGLDQSMDVAECCGVEVDARSRLMLAAGPVLDRLAHDLADTPFALLLADSDARIIDRRSSAAATARALDAVKAMPGLRYCEQTSGVNSLATAHELRRPIAVDGDEHFLESLREFSCFGAPIINPLTRRLEGVLDVSGPAQERTALLKPFVLRAASAIEQRLVDASRGADKALLAAFQTMAARRNSAVVALGGDLILSNAAASDLLRGEDHVTLRTLTEGIAGSGRALRTTIGTVSGSTLDVEAQGIEGASGVIVTIASSVKGEARRRSPRRQSSRTVTLISGEPGTGRTTTAVRIAGRAVLIFDAAADCGLDWLAAAHTALASGQTLVIDNVDQLAPRAANRLRSAIRTSAATVVLTSAPTEQLTGEQAALAATALSRTELKPVRNYGSKFAELAYTILRQHHPLTDVRFTPTALDVLAAQPWPGNIPELIDVVASAAGHRSSGDITDRDLPASHSTRPPGRLTKLERVERDAIIAVLQSVNGNKVAAAAELGIGRTTLYARLRHYRIPA